ncbi:glycosyltransferase family 2 protein [Aquamicrobium soli]|uniref:Glycosyltransferase family 2 protein n=1 Tax=Aquamicrobium soli TaxID=1811518 RepID=A0ABV7KFX1_9HYPH
MSTNSAPLTLEAVRSVLDQDIPVEVVVVNTGKGSLKDRLAHFGDQIKLLETPDRQFAGGTRNIGIENSRAPFVTFLAADCIAGPKSLKLRLKHHKKGAPTVASAIRPMPGRCGSVTTASWASCALTHMMRLPETPSDKAPRFSLSYDRKVLEKLGNFDESLRIGEDSELNARALPKFGIPIWDPLIVTFHRYPDTILSAMIDQFRRGRRNALFHKVNSRRAPWRTALGNLKYIRTVMDRARYPYPPELLASKWLILPLGIAHAAGSISAAISF